MRLFYQEELIFAFKSLIQKVLPSILVDIYRKFRNKQPQFSGVFDSFADPKDENPWDSKEWHSVSRSKLAKTLARNKKSDLLPLGCYGYSECLVIVNQMSRNNICQVLDFGGGTGFVYHLIKRGFIRPEKVYWHVVDCESLIKLGKHYQENSDNLFFHNLVEMQDLEMEFDILYMNTTLQYIREYRQLLSKLLLFKQKYVILTRLIAGNIRTFITSQNVFGRTTPCLFINLDELIGFVVANGYEVIFMSQCEVLDDDYYDESIPKSMRIPYAVNLIFERKEPRLEQKEVESRQVERLVRTVG